jgi:hypothetical protein
MSPAGDREGRLPPTANPVGRMTGESDTGQVERHLHAGHLAAAGGSVAALALIAGAIAGDHTVVGVPGLALPGAVLLLVGAMASAATVRPWGHRLAAALVTASLWVVAAVALAGSCFLLLNLIELALTGGMERGGRSGWVTFGERLAAAVLAALFVAAATSWRRTVTTGCVRCGRSHGPDQVALVRPAPARAPQRVRWAVYAGCASFVPYLTIHGLHSAGQLPSLDHLYSDGGLLGDSGLNPLVSFAILAVGLVGPALLLILGLVQRWGMVFPRWTLWLAGRHVPRFLLLVPVWLVAPTLALYGIGSVFYALVDGHDLWGLGGAASLAFGGYGCALGVAAVSYQGRTRRRCVPVGHR